jgi:16S rRNA (adenine1518-N6/adenine1519-N6)-dimethyltransferase
MTPAEPTLSSVPSPASVAGMALVPDQRQTQSYIKDLLRSYGLIPKPKMGQNFLIDLNLLNVVVQAAELQKTDSILEVGTGTGSLTGRLAAEAGAVTSVELDNDFHRLARHALGERDNVQLIHTDILAGKNELSPEVVRKYKQFSELRQTTQNKLIANLPYAVATPVIANLLLSDIVMERMVVMVQYEMAERMAARPGTKDFGALTILVQSLADVKIVRKIGPGVFWPPPAVDSAIVLVQPRADKRAALGNVKSFREFLRDLYTHRRKNLRVALSSWPSGKRDKTAIDAKLVALGIDGSGRAEDLDIATHQVLWRAFSDENENAVP